MNETEKVATHAGDCTLRLTIPILTGIASVVLFLVLIALVAGNVTQFLVLELSLVVVAVLLAIRPLPDARLTSAAVMVLHALILPIIADPIGSVGAAVLSVGVVGFICWYCIRQLHSRAGILRPVSVLEESAVAPVEHAQSVIARELRRSRRQNTELSLVLFPLSDLEHADRAPLVKYLKKSTREFDLLCYLSEDELAVLCARTSKYEAARMVARLDSALVPEDVAIASFPVDAVTSLGLIDAVRGADVGVLEAS